MLDEDIERRIREKRKNALFEFEDKRKDDRWDTCESCKLQGKNDIESYDKIMRSNPNYLFIFYTFLIHYKQILKIFLLTKVKILTRNIKNNRSFIVALIILISLVYYSYHC